MMLHLLHKVNTSCKSNASNSCIKLANAVVKDESNPKAHALFKNEWLYPKPAFVPFKKNVVLVFPSG